MAHKDIFQVDDRFEITVEGDTCSVSGQFDVSFPMASARFVWAEASMPTALGWGALRIEVGDEPCTTLALAMSSEQAHRLRLFLERTDRGASLH